MSFTKVLKRIRGAAERVGRDPESVTVVAITKSQPLEAIMEVYEAGHRDFGENRAQELVRKADRLPDDIRWHFVGRLQRNKARIVRPLVVMLHSMDSGRLAEVWLKGLSLPPPTLVQVNIGREPQKGGVDPDRTEELVDRLSNLGLEVRGLMAIPPLGPAEQSRPYFEELKALRERLAVKHPGLAELSMGMTDDYEVAVEEGSTMVRIGRAIFGPRRPDR